LVFILMCLGGVAEATTVALVGGTLLDGSQAAAVDRSVVLIEDERIIAVGTVDTVPVPENARVISTFGMTVLPGLVDLDVRTSELGHGDPAVWRERYLPLAERVLMPAAAQILLRHGVTSARDLGSPLGAAISVRDGIDAWTAPGPGLVVSGPALVPSPVATDRLRQWAVSGAPDAREAVQKLASRGVDLILVRAPAEFTRAELAAISEAAARHHLPWIAELHHDQDLAVAIEAGAAALVGLGEDVNDRWPEAGRRALARRAQEGRPVPWSVGGSVLTNLEWLQRHPDTLADPDWQQGMPALVAADIRQSLYPPQTLGSVYLPALRREALAARLKDARDAGARLLMGSSAGEPGQLTARAPWQEVELLVQAAGLSTAEAIHASTLGAAEALGVSGYTGSITPGKFADIIAVQGDLLRHIDRLQQLTLVMRHGIRYQ
jgi:imidazolonepropionase-like amidohydrolase